MSTRDDEWVVVCNMCGVCDRSLFSQFLFIGGDLELHFETNARQRYYLHIPIARPKDFSATGVSVKKNIGADTTGYKLKELQK